MNTTSKALMACAAAAMAFMAVPAATEAAQRHAGGMNQGQMHKNFGNLGGGQRRSARQFNNTFKSSNSFDYSNNFNNHRRQYSYRRHSHPSIGLGLPSIYLFSGDSYSYSYSCRSYYQKWQATGSSYWRSRYYDCLDG